MLFAELLDDLSSGCGNVTENAGNRGLLNEAIDHRRRKSIRVRRKGMLQNDACHFPVTRGRVFTIGSQRATAIRPSQLVQWRQRLQRTNVAESITLQIRKPHGARLENVTESIGAGITPIRGVRHCSNACAIQND